MRYENMEWQDWNKNKKMKWKKVNKTDIKRELYTVTDEIYIRDGI